MGSAIEQLLLFSGIQNIGRKVFDYRRTAIVPSFQKDGDGNNVWAQFYTAWEKSELADLSTDPLVSPSLPSCLFVSNSLYYSPITQSPLQTISLYNEDTLRAEVYQRVRKWTQVLTRAASTQIK
jgi:hypothetical protein